MSWVWKAATWSCKWNQCVDLLGGGQSVQHLFWSEPCLQLLSLVCSMLSGLASLKCAEVHRQRKCANIILLIYCFTDFFKLWGMSGGILPLWKRLAAPGTSAAEGVLQDSCQSPSVAYCSEVAGKAGCKYQFDFAGETTPCHIWDVTSIKHWIHYYI